MRLVLLALALAACGEVVEVTPDAVDPCQDGCECTVETEVADCGAHAVCGVAETSRTCACAPAYRDQAGACVFDVAPLDPGFTNTTAWVPSGLGASIDTTFVGIDPGAGNIDGLGLCDYRALTQTFVMPPFDRAEPFKVTVTYTATDPSFQLGNANLYVDIGGQIFEDRINPGQVKNATFCLGERAYGGPVEFKVATRGGPFTCPSSVEGHVSIDQLVVQPATADECPNPGTIPNADFEGTSGWTFTTRFGGTAAIVDGVGESSSRGVRLSTPQRCDEATMTGQIALPVEGTIQNPAIDVFYSANSSGGRLTVSLDGKNVSVLESSTGRHAHICVPKWALGTTGSLGFLLERNADGAGACTTVLNRSFVVDNISLVSDATCGAPADLGDPGFERIAVVNGPTPGWGLTHGHVNDTEDFVGVFNNSFSAHTGSGALQMNSRAVCAIVGGFGADVTITVPPASGAAGPAVKFFANVPTSNINSETRVSISPEVDFLVPLAAGYQPQVVCVPPKLIGRTVLVRFSTGGRGGGCSTYANETALIDDVTIGTDAACPAN
ncbi:MAG: hypothetical protein ABI867_17150 [Kofleriaceae bacterium]